MCFSATASFAAAALLVPAGGFTIARALRHNRRYLPIAAFPLLFGIQQFAEGLLWRGLGGSPSIDAGVAALGFLAFAYFLWPTLVPLAAATIEPPGIRRRLFIGFTAIGGAFGASLYLPLLVETGWLEVLTVKGSILYEPRLIWDPYLPRGAVRAFYALIVAVPLLFSSIPAVRGFGILILASVVASAIVFAYAFVSIWCFIAALLSLSVIRIIRAIPDRPRAG